MAIQGPRSFPATRGLSIRGSGRIRCRGGLYARPVGRGAVQGFWSNPGQAHLGSQPLRPDAVCGPPRQSYGRARLRVLRKGEGEAMRPSKRTPRFGPPGRALKRPPGELGFQGAPVPPFEPGNSPALFCKWLFLFFFDSTLGVRCSTFMFSCSFPAGVRAGFMPARAARICARRRNSRSNAGFNSAE